MTVRCKGGPRALAQQSKDSFDDVVEAAVEEGEQRRAMSALAVLVLEFGDEHGVPAGRLFQDCRIVCRANSQSKSCR
jgi:hypothetical protein